MPSSNKVPNVSWRDIQQAIDKADDEYQASRTMDRGDYTNQVAKYIAHRQEETVGTQARGVCCNSMAAMETVKYD